MARMYFEKLKLEAIALLCIKQKWNEIKVLVRTIRHWMNSKNYNKLPLLALSIALPLAINYTSIMRKLHNQVATDE